MKGIEWRGVLVSLIAIVIIVSILSYFAIVAKGGVDWESLLQGIQPQLGEPSETFWENLENPFGTVEDIEVQRLISEEAEPYFKDEIGCEIADYIFNDFTRNGISVDRKNNCDTKTGKCSVICNERSQCLVGVGTFELKKDLPDVTEQGILSAFGCSVCPVDSFDEICINKMLSEKELGAQSFCSEQISVGGETIRFTNPTCYWDGETTLTPERNSPAWRDSCSTYCANGAPISTQAKYSKIYRWYSDPGYSGDGGQNNVDEGISYYFIQRPLSFSPNPYMYGVAWNNQIDAYELWFVRIPPKVTFNSISLIFIPQYFTDQSVAPGEHWDYDMGKWQRVNQLGYFYPEARRILDYTIESLSHDKNIITLENEIRSESGDTVDYQYCSSEDECFNRPALTDREMPKGKYGYCDEFWEYRQDKFNSRTILLRTNIPDENLKFKEGYKYRVAIQNWVDKYDETFKPSDANCAKYFDRSVIIYEYPPEQDGTTNGGNGGNGGKVPLGGVCTEDADCIPPYCYDHDTIEIVYCDTIGASPPYKCKSYGKYDCSPGESCIDGLGPPRHATCVA
ncbi:MAG: hypothetical protein ACW99A_18265 [Candidatus Kariarchaeaceae archaeon]|jgi:hypothetical protein